MSLAWSGDPKDENADPLAHLPVVFIDEWRDNLDAKSMTFWRVYNRIARAWYEQEYGILEMPDRWYHPAMIFMECLADGWGVDHALDYIKPRRMALAKSHLANWERLKSECGLKSKTMRASIYLGPDHRLDSGYGEAWMESSNSVRLEFRSLPVETAIRVIKAAMTEPEAS